MWAAGVDCVLDVGRTRGGRGQNPCRFQGLMGRQEERVYKGGWEGAAQEAENWREWDHVHWWKLMPTTRERRVFFLVVELKPRELSDSHRSSSLSVGEQACGWSQQPQVRDGSTHQATCFRFIWQAPKSHIYKSSGYFFFPHQINIYFLLEGI